MIQAERRRVLFTGVGSTFVMFLCYLGLTPLYPTVASDLHTGPDGLGLLIGLSSLVSAVLQIPIGVLADKVGRRPVISAGTVTLAASQLMRWGAHSPILFGAAQAMLGVTLPLLTAAAYAAVADAYGARGKAEALGYLQASTNVGQIAGFALAAVFGTALGWRNLSLGFALLPLAMVPLALSMPEPERRSSTSSVASLLKEAARAIVQVEWAALALTAALTLGAGVAAIYLLPFLAQKEDMSSSTTGLLLMPYVVGAVVGGPVVGSLADRLGARSPLLGVLVLGLSSCFALALFGPTIPAVIVCYTLIGATVGATLSVAAAQIVHLAVGAGVGTGAALGGLRLGQGIGPSLGPAFAGVIFVNFGVRTSLTATGGLLAVALIVAIRAVPSSPPVTTH